MYVRRSQSVPIASLHVLVRVNHEKRETVIEKLFRNPFHFYFIKEVRREFKWSDVCVCVNKGKAIVIMFIYIMNWLYDIL